MPARERIEAAAADEAARPGATPDSVRKVLAAQRAVEVAATLRDIALDVQVTFPDGLRIVFDRPPEFVLDRAGRVIGIDAQVRAYRGARQVFIDGHRRCVNPPTSVPHPTLTERLTDPLTGAEIERPVMVDDPRAAYFAWLERSIEQTPNPAGFGTRGTVTTVYSGTGDGFLYCDDATYTDATRGLGTLTTDTGQFQTYAGIYIPSGYQALEAFHLFDTSGIDDADAVSQVDLNLYHYADESGVGFTLECYADDFGTLTTADWVSSLDMDSGDIIASIASSSWSGSGYQTLTENGSAFQSAINKTGTTYVMLATSRMRTEAGASGNEYLGWRTSDITGTSNDPYIDVTHAAAGATGTAALTLAEPQIAAAGGQEFTGTAALTTALPTIAASGVMQPSGTAALTTQVPQVAASGAETYTGTAALTTAEPVIAAAGKAFIPGTAALTLAEPLIASSGLLTYTGTAAITLLEPVFAATGTSVTPGQGTVEMTEVGASVESAEVAATAGLTEVVASLEITEL